ncbi:MAG TPA: endolytic transglycosylase MltG [Candidatus Aphodocola excrementigallinarum]|uniref:Endolytic murein transglycosylase n=1 Tax=Candidatus Aphodocola excrementigallinarum TaxID=2840670 RepID=A0A9D1IQG6_9FIRM|nr:endolytic transglycosylase MltG [Candidatus Aphodocola excrementigallinarum]
MAKEEVLDFEEKPKKKKRRLKKWVRILLRVILVLFILLIVGIIALSFLFSAPQSKSEVIEFTIEEGQTVYQVGDKLKQEGIIRSEFAYKVYVKLNNVNSYKAGVYKLDKSYPLKDIVSLLTGDYYKEEGTSITFKEGKNIRQIANEVSKHTNVSEGDFLSVMEDDNYINELINKYWFLTDDIKNDDIYYPLEGYLFPETYNFNKNVTAKEIIETMLDQEDEVLSKYKSKIDSSSYSVHEIVTLASLVEQEGIYDDDRKMIAGVFYNRLNAGMSLGSDVTTYYAARVDLGERDLTSSEINTYNPYNTRGPGMNGKLPVGPISNFSETSLSAVLSPTDSDYYYFVADKSGKTHFTRTYEEHQKLVNELKEAGNWIEW